MHQLHFIMDQDKHSRSATFYHETSAHQKEVGLNLLALASASFEPGATILDLGCGTGHLATLLSESVGTEGRVVAVDPDADRIKLAKEKHARPNIDYLVADDQSFPVSNYQLILANHVIHWIKNKEATFKKVYESLVPGGKFIFVTFDGTPKLPPVIQRAFSELFHPGFKDYLVQEKMIFLTASEYSAIANSVGLSVTSVRTEETHVQWTSVDHFLQFWAGVCHGDIDLNSIDPIALQQFKEKDEKELISLRLSRQVLYMECTKSYY